MKNLVNQAEFSRLMNVSRKTVTKWKERGWLVFSGDLVNISETTEILKRYRAAGVTSEGSKVTTQGNRVTGNSVVEIQDDETVSEAADRIMNTIGANMSMDEARRVKENYLALLNQLEYQKKSGELVEMQLAQKVLFDEFRSQRDAWLNFPSRVGAMLASDLSLPADKVTEVLTKYVHEQISTLGDPQYEFS